MALAGWPVGTTKKFTGGIEVDGLRQNISADRVTLTLKRRKSMTDAEAALVVDADVTSYGTGGMYLMTVDPANTDDVDPRKYYYDIVWRRSTGEEYVLESGEVYLTERVSDTGDD